MRSRLLTGIRWRRGLLGITQRSGQPLWPLPVTCLNGNGKPYTASQSWGPPSWRHSSAIDEWVQREARPISLRQLTFFGRTLTEARLLSSANYVRTELPTRIAHRLRDMQTLPYVVVANPHISHVFELYYKAFENFRRIPEINSVDDNDEYCKVIEKMLMEHLTVIPRLATGILEIQGLMKAEDTDKFMNNLLRSRISRRVIAEQHLALTETFHSPWHFPTADDHSDRSIDSIGKVFLHCNAKEVVERCTRVVQGLVRKAYGPNTFIPEVIIQGNYNVTFPYILSHLEYIVGELLRNSIQATIEQRRSPDVSPPPIEVLICDTPQHVIMRISDQGGGILPEILPHLWSFSKGPRRERRLENLRRVPKMAATLQEVNVTTDDIESVPTSSPLLPLDDENTSGIRRESSLSSLTSRPPELRLGVGLPMSRIYAEYWAGSLEIHNLEGYGADAFLQIPKLGNKNEQLTTRASMDAV